MLKRVGEEKVPIKKEKMECQKEIFIDRRRLGANTNIKGEFIKSSMFITKYFRAGIAHRILFKG